MPKFTFMCPKCKASVQKLTSASIKTIPCDFCLVAEMEQQLPNLNGPAEVRETVNQYTNTKWKKDQKDMITERQDEYFWTVEVPRLVQTYSLETCLEQGWVFVDDNGQVQLHTKPPHKR